MPKQTLIEKRVVVMVSCGRETKYRPFPGMPEAQAAAYAEKAKCHVGLEEMKAGVCEFCVWYQTRKVPGPDGAPLQFRRELGAQDLALIEVEWPRGGQKVLEVHPNADDVEGGS